MLKKLLISLIMVTTALLAAAHTLPASETVTYKVMYKWGMVNKQAGTVTMKLSRNGSVLNGLLTARTQPWADKLYKVRDTLRVTMDAATLAPSFYEKISHEGKEHKHDVVRYTRTPSKTTGNCTRKKWDDQGRLKVDEKRTLQAQGTTLDMMSAYYYMRTLPYENFKAGHVVTVNVFSGKRQELLTIKYQGRQKVKVEGKTWDCYHVTFIFTSDGRTKTSDDMDAWISATPARLPVKLVGKLSVGKVVCVMSND